MEKEHEKGVGAYFALTPDSFGRTFPLAEEHFDWRKRIIR
jgi:hypothetical protein